MSPYWQKNLPNFLTYSRILCAIPIAMVMHFDSMAWGIVAAFFFISASITDYYDGYYARKFNVISSMGQFMDPVADKILVSASLVMLQYLDRVGPSMVILLISRDLVIGGLRSVAASNGVVIPAGSSGKLKTGIQMVCIPILMINWAPFGLVPLPLFAKIGLWASVVLSTVSGYQYVHGYFTAERLKADLKG